MSYSRSDLLKVPVPEQTRTYVPVSTGLIFDTIDQLALENGMTIINEEHDLAAKGQVQKMKFMFDTNNDRFKFEIVVINSYNKSISLRAAGGAAVFACFNGMVIGDYRIQEKHMANVREDLYEFLKALFETKDQQIQDAQRVWDIYNNIQLDQLEFAHIGGELFFIDKLLNSSEMMILLREMEKPTIKYEGLNEYSLNHLYQLVTFAIKGAHPHDFLKKSKNVQQYFNTYVEMLV